MKFKMVKFHKMKPDQPGHEVVLELFYNEVKEMVDGGALTNFGAKLFNFLSEMPLDVDGRSLTFNDGEEYLTNVYRVYKSPYLAASRYEPQDSELPD